VRSLGTIAYVFRVRVTPDGRHLASAGFWDLTARHLGDTENGRRCRPRENILYCSQVALVARGRIRYAGWWGRATAGRDFLGMWWQAANLAASTPASRCWRRGNGPSSELACDSAAGGGGGNPRPRDLQVRSASRARKPRRPPAIAWTRDGEASGHPRVPRRFPVEAGAGQT